MKTGKVAVALFGDYYRERRTRFSFLTNDLVKARMYVTVERWLSLATLYSLIMSSVCVTVGLAAAAFLFNYVPIWRFIFGKDVAGADITGLVGDCSLIVFVTLACCMVLPLCPLSPG